MRKGKGKGMGKGRSKEELIERWRGCKRIRGKRKRKEADKRGRED
jgi:hypothetical protein